jgi:eukaryotic-like serine/threonine-protein kinase
MRTGRAGLARAIDSVVEGTSGLDWGLMTIELDNERDRELLRHIRLLSQISDVQRTQAGVLDDATLRARAQALASVLPFGGTARVREDETPTQSQDLGEPASLPRWGRVELLELVGSGTFGDVYRARDLQLQREVAVKLLHRISPHTGLVDRMLLEARALARVRHPNVVVVHDAEERDGRVGLCMEFIRGRTLSQILATEGARGAREAALVGQELCHALAAVHGAGLVHRDVKAQNVMREDGGRVVLMDFGAGLTLSDGRTSPGSVTGTPLYLAPEVLEHGEASVRSDIYSLGVLLYHLVTNDYPLHGQTPAELIEARRQGRVRRLRDAAPALPSWFVRAVERAIAPNPQDRFATAGEFEAALGDRPSMRVWPLLAVAALTLAVVAGVQQLWPSAKPASPHPVVALLPLDPGLGVSGPVAAAVTDEIYQGLATLDTVRVISSFSAARAKREQSSMSKIAGVLQVSAVIDGTVSEANGQFEVNLRVFEAGTDAPMSAQTLHVTTTGFGSLKRDAALSIANAIKVAVSPRILAQLARSPTLNTQAFDAFTLGRQLHERAGLTDFDRARDAYEQTITLAPSFAPAYGALARLHVDIADGGHSSWAASMELAKANALKAINLDAGLAEAHVVLGQVAFQLDWNWGVADAAYQRSIAFGPSYDVARQCYSHFLAARGRLDQAFAELAEARRLNPLSETNDLELVPLLQYARRFPEAETLTRASQGRDPNVFQGYAQFGRIFAATGRYDAAIVQFQKLRDSSIGNNPYIDAEIASAHAAAGRIVEAEAILDRLIERSRSEEVPPELFAFIYARLGRFDDAFQQLDEAFKLKSRRILFLKVDPRWDPLRSDPRFGAFERRLGL